jgi:benzoyl-CoA reductase/2-hydroxyglutaryl-CoA dehydratase subunit BcrC/BadD/HgdB
MDNKIGITTTVPIEILLAAGYRPVDLNNVFINDPEPERLVKIAERAGFPLNCCTWIKGLYGVCMEQNIETVLCVTTGDCSNTIMLMEVFKLRHIKAIPFAYPEKPDVSKMQAALEALATAVGTTLETAEVVRQELGEARRLAHELDRLTWAENRANGLENHLWLVSASDFNQNFRIYENQLAELNKEIKERQQWPTDELRLAYTGVPSVYGRELYPYLEGLGVRVVFNEIQRQFAMPHPGASLADQYSNYTYPYSIYDRLKDIAAEIDRRRIDGLIHYVQAFCHRGIGDIILRDAVKLPVLTLEGNDDFHLSQHVKTRLEAFVDMINYRRQQTGIKNDAIAEEV